MQRDMKLMCYQFEKYIDSIKKQSELVEVDVQHSEKEKSPVLSQLDPFFNDPSFWEQIDKITNQGNVMKKMVNDLPSFKLFCCSNQELETPPSSQFSIKGFADIVEDAAANPIQAEEVFDDSLGASHAKLVVEDVLLSINEELDTEPSATEPIEGANVQVFQFLLSQWLLLQKKFKLKRFMMLNIMMFLHMIIILWLQLCIVLYIASTVSSQENLVSTQENIDVLSTQDIFGSLSTLANLSAQEWNEQI